MIRLVRSQLIGLRTLRSSYGIVLGIAGVVLVAVVGGLRRNLGAAYVDPLGGREPVIIAVGLITAVVVCVFAATGVAGDYRYGTIAERLLANPRRGRQLSASLLTYAAFALAVAVGAMGLALALAEPIVSARNLSLGLSVPVVAAPVVAVPLLAVVGVGVGTICRSQPAAVLLIIGWFPAEKLLGPVLGDRAAYLPYGLVEQFLGLAGATVSRGTALACLGGYAAAVSLLAAALLTHRDVT